MPTRFMMTVSELHSKWLEDTRRKKGLFSTQDVVRALIAEAYENEINLTETKA